MIIVTYRLHTYMQVKGTIIVPDTAGAGAAVSNTNKTVILKNCVQFTNCIIEIIKTQVDDVQDIDLVMPMYNLIEYSDVYLRTSGSLLQYYRDECGFRQ